MTLLLRLGIAGLSAQLATVSAAAQGPPPRDARSAGQPSAVGTGVIAGTVTMAGSTQPARKVRVSLSGAELRGGRSATTDDNGRFSFTALPPGRFNLTATRPGHLPVTYGQYRPGRAGTPIQLSDGQKFQADLQIPKGSVITGTVLDENGEPAPQTSVRVLRVAMQNGRRTLQGGSSAMTDDRGIYRVFGLMPGDYAVCATPRNANRGESEAVRAELQALQQTVEAVSRVSEEQARGIQERIAALQGATPENEDGPLPGYAPVCYPGTWAMASATAVTLGIGEERPGIDIQLQLAPLARVEGTVMNASGAQVREITVTLTDAQQAGVNVGNISGRTDGEGRFQLLNVPPGQYRLAARARIAPPRPQAPPAPPPGGRGGGRGSRIEPVVVWAATDITVDGRTVSNVLVTLQQGISVSGQVAFDGAATPPADITRLRVTMTPAEPTPLAEPSSAFVDAGGRFTLASVPPGRYRLNASGAPGWFLESSAIGGQEALDVPFEVKGNQNLAGAAITFTDRQTEVTGMLTDDRNQPAVAYTLVVFPSDSRYWSGGSRRMQNVRPSTDGRFALRGLPPGDYRIVPVVDLEPGATSDPAYLQLLEATALRFSLQPGEKKVQDVRVGSY